MTFENACESHREVLSKAFVGITAALKQGCEEERARALDKFFERLNQNGFELSEPEPPVFYCYGFMAGPQGRCCFCHGSAESHIRRHHA